MTWMTAYLCEKGFSKTSDLTLYVSSVLYIQYDIAISIILAYYMTEPSWKLGID